MEAPHRIFRSLRHIHLKIEQNGNAVLKEYHLTLVQGQTLMYLLHQENHCSSMKALEKELEIAQSTTAGLVSRLEKNGFLEVYPDPEDKRMKWVKMTDKAQECAEKIYKMIGEVDDKIMSAFTPVEQTMFLQLLEKLEDSL